jgi:hypothetical protein
MEVAFEEGGVTGIDADGRRRKRKGFVLSHKPDPYWAGSMFSKEPPLTGSPYQRRQLFESGVWYCMVLLQFTRVRL